MDFNEAESEITELFEHNLNFRHQTFMLVRHERVLTGESPERTWIVGIA